MKALRHYFYLDLIYQNCFARSRLVERAPSMKLLYSFALCIFQVKKSMRNINQQHLFDI